MLATQAFKAVKCCHCAYAPPTQAKQLRLTQPHEQLHKLSCTCAHTYMCIHIHIQNTQAYHMSVCVWEGVCTPKICTVLSNMSLAGLSATVPLHVFKHFVYQLANQDLVETSARKEVNRRNIMNNFLRFVFAFCGPVTKLDIFRPVYINRRQ